LTGVSGFKVGAVNGHGYSPVISVPIFICRMAHTSQWE
jgi:hypothetical protein